MFIPVIFVKVWPNTLQMDFKISFGNAGFIDGMLISKFQ
jgi:hypothetical protein